MLQGQAQHLSGQGLAGLGVCREAFGKPPDVSGQTSGFGAQGVRFLRRQIGQGHGRALACGVPVHAVVLAVVLGFGQQGGVLLPQMVEHQRVQLLVTVRGKYPLTGQGAHAPAQAGGDAHAHDRPPAAAGASRRTVRPALRKKSARRALTMARLDCR